MELLDKSVGAYPALTLILSCKSFFPVDPSSHVLTNSTASCGS